MLNFLLASASLASEVPLRVYPSGLVAVDVGCGEHIVPMILDLGASRTVLTRESQALFGLAEPWRTVDAEAIGGQIAADLYRSQSFTIGDHTFEAPLIAVIDLSPLLETIGGEFGGILGADFFASADVALDTTRGIAQVLPAGSFRADADWTAVPLQRRRGDLWVRAEVDGERFPALVDTGADATGLDPGVVAALGLSLAPAATGVQGADGRVVPLSLTSIQTLSISGTCLSAGTIQATAEQTTGRVGSVHLGTDRLYAQPIALSVARRRLFVAPHSCADPAL